MSTDFLNGGFFSAKYFSRAIFELISKRIDYLFILACVIAAAIGCLLSETTQAILSLAISLVSGIEITRKPPRKPPDKIKNSNQIRRRFFWIPLFWINQERHKKQNRDHVRRLPSARRNDSNGTSGTHPRAEPIRARNRRRPIHIRNRSDRPPTFIRSTSETPDRNPGPSDGVQHQFPSEPSHASTKAGTQSPNEPSRKLLKAGNLSGFTFASCTNIDISVWHGSSKSQAGNLGNGGNCERHKIINADIEQIIPKESSLALLKTQGIHIPKELSLALLKAQGIQHPSEPSRALWKAQGNLCPSEPSCTLLKAQGNQFRNDPSHQLLVGLFFFLLHGNRRPIDIEASFWSCQAF